MTVNIYLIPLTNVPQEFVINLANVIYTLTVKWNDSPDSGWIMDIADENQNPIAVCLPLITGDNILDGLDYLGIDGALFAYTNGDVNAVPTLDNLGTDSNLYFQTTATNNG
jgi:hypothetical protein